jgi:hypothetical protein
MEAGCGRAAEAASAVGLSKMDRLGLYDMYLTGHVAPHRVALLAQRSECAIAPYDPVFAASCGRFYENCKREELVSALDDEKIRSVMQEYRDEITAGTFVPAIGDWDVSRVQDMTGLFKDWSDFNQPIGKWNTSAVYTMREMFSGAARFNQPLDMWDTSLVEDMAGMFMNATAFNQRVRFNTSNVRNMSGMFWNASSLNQEMKFYTMSVLTVADMFRGATSQRKKIELTDLCMCKDMARMLRDTEGARVKTWRAQTKVLNALDREDWTEWLDRFSVSPGHIGCFTMNFGKLPFGGDDSSVYKHRKKMWDHLPTELKLRTLMQAGCEKAAYAVQYEGKAERNELYSTYLTDEIEPTRLFPRGECNLDQDPHFTSGCNRFYQNCAASRGQSVGDRRVASLSNESIRAVMSEHKDAIIEGRFYPPIGEWSVQGVTDMTELFRGWDKFNQPLAGWDTRNVESMKNMFMYAKAFNQPLPWNTSRVKNMSGMFHVAQAFNQPLTFDTLDVRDMSWMFAEAKNFNSEVDFSSTVNVTDMSSMFSGAASFNKPISLDTHSLEKTESMFYDMISLECYVTFTSLRVLVKVDNMFERCNEGARLVSIKSDVESIDRLSRARGFMDFKSRLVPV